MRYKIWADAIRERDFGVIADWFILYFFLTGFAALSLAGMAAGLTCESAATPLVACAAFSWNNGVRVFSLGLLLAGACWVCGWLFGLLFGVPRSLNQAPSGNAQPAPTNGDPAELHRPSSRVNTNLEDISDWLTKTLVGVGLTQLTSLPTFLGNLARDIDDYGFGWQPHGHLLALGVILYFFPGGFWLGYVGTRTFLTRLFEFFDPSISPDKLRLAASPENMKLSDSGILPASGLLEQIDKALRNLPLQALRSNAEVVAWGAAQARDGNYEAARVALEGALRNDPENPGIRQQLAKVKLASKEYDDTAELLQGTPDTPATVLAALYEPQPASFTKAIAVGERLAKDSKYKDDANLHAWLACGYAQQYGYLQRQNAADGKLPAIKQQVLSEIKAAIALQSSIRSSLKAFWHPEKDSIDNDLSVFAADDPELTALLDPPAATPAQAAPLNPDGAPPRGN